MPEAQLPSLANHFFVSPLHLPRRNWRKPVCLPLFICRPSLPASSGITASAAGRPVIEFGSRRAHGIEAGVFAARAAFIGGCQGTCNTYAGFRFGIPVYGTQAIPGLWLMKTKATAFCRFWTSFPRVQHFWSIRTLSAQQSIRSLRSGANLAVSAWTVEIFSPIVFGPGSGSTMLAGRMCRSLSPEISTKSHRESAASVALLSIAFGVGTALSTSCDAPYLGVDLQACRSGDRGRSPRYREVQRREEDISWGQAGLPFCWRRWTILRRRHRFGWRNVSKQPALLEPVMRKGRHE